MGLIRVTASQLRTAAGEIRSLNGQFKSQVGNLEAGEGTLASQWEGEAKNAFHKAFLDDKAKWEEFYKLIEEYCIRLEEIAKKYEEAENRTTSIATTRKA